MDAAITEDNCIDLAWDYLLQEYGEEVADSIGRCPYDMPSNNAELEFKQTATWFMCERKNSSGRTVVEEFVERFVDDPGIASKLLQMRNLVRGQFLVEAPPDHNGIMRISSKSSGKTFSVEYLGGERHLLSVGRSFSGMIHPWRRDGTYRTTGITLMSLTDEEIFQRYGFITPKMTDVLLGQMRKDWQDEAESIAIAPRSRAHTLLKKLPADWVRGMCDSLCLRRGRTKRDNIALVSSALTSLDSLQNTVSKLGRDEVDALLLVLRNGGFAKYPYLCSRVGEDDTEWSWEEEPRSAVGRLRRRGLLIVGKKRISGRSYKVAVIPADVIGPLESCLSGQE